MLAHKTSVNEFKKIEIISCIFSDHTAVKVEINHKKKMEKYKNKWKLSNVLLNNEQVNSDIKEEIKRYLATKVNENTTTQICGTQGNQSQEGNSLH